jgi:hypothetical protein
MNCDEFRERCHLLLDARKSELTDEEMLTHESACRDCADFRSELMAIDAGLRDLPVPVIPASLVDSIMSMGRPEVPSSPAWRPDIERAARYLVPGLLLWSAQWAFPENARPFFLAAMTFIGGFVLVSSIVRPWVLGSPEL